MARSESWESITTSQLLHALWNKRETRGVSSFVVILAAFATIQGIYAFRMDSLGLLSDAFHMFFHCIALSISLVGMVYAKRPATFAFSYGFDRYEVLAAFANSLMLIFVVLFVCAGALERLIEPASFDPSTLLSLEFGVVGLIINVVGVVALGPGASAVDHLTRFRQVAAAPGRATIFSALHRGPDGTSDSYGASGWGALASPSHADAIKVHVSGGGGESGTTVGTGAYLASASAPPAASSSHATNMHAIYLHFYSDAISSIAVILSSLLIRYRGFAWADTVQSLAVSVFTLYIVVPLFTATGKILLQSTPLHLKASLDRCRREISIMDGVLEVTDEHYWTQAPGYNVGSISLRVRADAKETELVERATRVFSRVLSDITVQVEKDTPLGYTGINGMSSLTPLAGSTSVPRHTGTASTGGGGLGGGTSSGSMPRSTFGAEAATASFIAPGRRVSVGDASSGSGSAVPVPAGGGGNTPGSRGAGGPAVWQPNATHQGAHGVTAVDAHAASPQAHGHSHGHGGTCHGHG